MARSKERSEVEYLRGELRKVKSENRNLKKQLSRANKRGQQYEDIEDKLRELELEQSQEQVEVENKNKCPKCKGDLKITPLGIKFLVTCEGCNFRETKK